MAGSSDGACDVLLGLVGSTDEPIAGGRHKVFGHPEFAVIPQTSTIGSHAPRALGVPFAIERAHQLGVRGAWPEDAITVCSFGDASANHSTTVGAINAACCLAHQDIPIPLLFVCEDNGIGISVPTPPGWIQASYSNRSGLRYFAADGADSVDVHDTAIAAAAWVRAHRRPAFLHVSMVRFGGRAGSDVESAYRSSDQVRDDYTRDPLLGTARALIQASIASPNELIIQYNTIGTCVAGLADSIRQTPRRLTNAGAVMQPIAPGPTQSSAQSSGVRRPC
jgi:2-oxoisovalerate dehydrogenase E1 component